MGIETALISSAGASVLGGLMGSRAAKSAAQVQSDATDRATQSQYDMYDRQRADAKPWMDAGREGLATLRQLTLNGEFSKPLSVADVQAEPGYQFGLDQGLKATGRQLAKLQGRSGGATLKALTRFGNDYGSTKYGDAWNRANADRGFRYNSLANLAGVGQQAVNQVSSSGQALASNVGNLNTSGGAARAAGIVGSANAIGNGLTGAGNSLLQYQMFNKLFPSGGGGGTPTFSQLQNAQYPGQY